MDKKDERTECTTVQNTEKMTKWASGHMYRIYKDTEHEKKMGKWTKRT